jgi:CMD domain protein
MNLPASNSAASNVDGSSPDGPIVSCPPKLDLIDQLAALQPGGATHLLRHQRDKVALATQGSYDGLFDPALPGVTLLERLQVSLFACRISNADALAAHYRSRLQELSTDAIENKAAQALIEAGVSAELASLPDVRLRAMLNFTRTLILTPVEGDKAALLALSAAGISTPAVVTLAQLIAFLSYQIRLVSSLAALQAAQQRRASKVST